MIANIAETFREIWPLSMLTEELGVSLVVGLVARTTQALCVVLSLAVGAVDDGVGVSLVDWLGVGGQSQLRRFILGLL